MSHSLPAVRGGSPRVGSGGGGGEQYVAQSAGEYLRRKGRYLLWKVSSYVQDYSCSLWKALKLKQVKRGRGDER